MRWKVLFGNWGTGTARREFLHVDDCADACVLLLREYSEDIHINVGSGEDIAIADLARLICTAVGLVGELRFNTSYPDGTPRKLMAADLLRGLGWRPGIALEDGIRSTYLHFLDHVASNPAC